MVEIVSATLLLSLVARMLAGCKKQFILEKLVCIVVDTMIQFLGRDCGLGTKAPNSVEGPNGNESYLILGPAFLVLGKPSF